MFNDCFLQKWRPWLLDHARFQSPYFRPALIFHLIEIAIPGASIYPIDSNPSTILPSRYLLSSISSSRRFFQYPAIFMLSSSPTPVILFRPSTRSCSTSTPDPYAHLLSQPSPRSLSKQPSYQPVFLPVFETTFDHEHELETILRQGGHLWGGVVVTSQRAVEAWEQAVASVQRTSWPLENNEAGSKDKGKGKAPSVESSVTLGKHQA